MTGLFWAAGLPWRITFARVYPQTWAIMHQTAPMRQLPFFGDSHAPYCRAFHCGR